MDIKSKFGAEIKIEREGGEKFFLIKRRGEIGHKEFMHSLLALIKKDQLLIHHPVGIAVVLITHEKAEFLRKKLLVDKIGPIRVNRNLLSKLGQKRVDS